MIGILQSIFMARETRRKVLFTSEFWHNNWLVALVILLLILNIMITMMVAYQVRPVNSPVPTRFTSFANFDRLGGWTNFYLLPVMSWLIAFINVYLAQLVYKRSRITSVIMVVATFVMTLLVLQTSSYFIGVSYGPR